jgi:hypothetical protein
MGSVRARLRQNEEDVKKIIKLTLRSGTMKSLIAVTAIASVTLINSAYAAPFVKDEFATGNLVIELTQPVMSCPSPDDVVVALKGQSHEWLAAHRCVDLEPNTRWVVASSGSERRKATGETINSWFGLASKARWDAAKVPASRDTFGSFTYQARLALALSWVANLTEDQVKVVPVYSKEECKRLSQQWMDQQIPPGTPKRWNTDGEGGVDPRLHDAPRQIAQDCVGTSK